MIIGYGGYARIHHPPRTDKVIPKQYGGKLKFIQRYTNEDDIQIANGEIARKIFDPETKMSRDLLGLYKRPHKYFSEIRNYYKGDMLHYLREFVYKKNDLKLFYRIMVNMGDFMNGLVRLHKEGWVHRDIKPSNILYDNKSFYLIDWATALKFLDSFSEKYNNWHEGDNSNLPPEYKSFAHFKYKFPLENDDFAQEYIKNGNVSKIIIKIQHNYIKKLRKANKHIQKELESTTDLNKLLTKIAPKTDVFAMGLVLSQIYIVLAMEDLYDKPIHTDITRIFRNMLNPNPFRRWTMKKSVNEFNKILPKIKHYIKK